MIKKTGTPVEFCDGGYTRMHQKFMNYAFGHGDDETLPVASIAVAGSQSTGKLTLLRRLFGIEARASSGKTTNGINCCKIKFVNDDVKKEDKQLIIVDTEGIGSIDKGVIDKRRDNKIILGALASSSIFILNIMRNATDVQIMDVILWACNKLHSSNANNSIRNIRNNNGDM